MRCTNKVTQARKRYTTALIFAIAVCLVIMIFLIWGNGFKKRNIVKLRGKFINDVGYILDEETLHVFREKFIDSGEYILYLDFYELMYDLKGNCYEGKFKSAECSFPDFSEQTLTGGVYSTDNVKLINFTFVEDYEILYSFMYDGVYRAFRKKSGVENSYVRIYTVCDYYLYNSALTDCTGDDLSVAKMLVDEFDSTLESIGVSKEELFAFIDWYIVEMKEVWK